MQRQLQTLIIAFLVALASRATAAEADSDAAAENQCIACHGNPDVWEKDTLRLLVKAADLAADIHWQKGILCHDCHGGNPQATKLREAHAEEDGFRTLTKPEEQAKPEDGPDFCGRCHSDAKYMKRFQPSPKTDPVAQFWESVHGKHLRKVGADKQANAATCTTCHPKHAIRVAADPQSSLHPRRLVETCGNCHKDQRTALRKGVHHAAGERNEQGAGTPLDCLKCHGRNVHALVPVRDSRSPVILEHQVQTCGGCHPKDRATYDASLHGRGLYESGLQITAVCADCHGAHGIYYAADRRSTLHAANVAKTCGKCHRYIDERLEKSVHGRGSGAGGIAAKPSPGGKSLRKPSCVDCHQTHDQVHPESAGFRLQLPNRCGNCHADYALRYGLSLHGQLTHMGYEPSAKCSDCHGAHDILPVREAGSPLSDVNRLETCRKCHVNAVANFTRFDPHANQHDARLYPWLYRISTAIETLLNLVLVVFLAHAVLWFVRSLLHTLRFGRHQRLISTEHAVLRLAPFQRLSYILVVVSFLGLMLTGLPLKYSAEPWARQLASRLGGFGSTSLWHRGFALLLLSICGLHLLWGVRKLLAFRQQHAGRILLLGPDSPVPNRRDLRDATGMLRWFLGLGRKPTFERWTYWEKFDYWMMYLAMLLIGTSGLMLWFPNAFSLLLPGQALNIAYAVHAETALLTASILLIIHLFNAHFRPEKFPMDLSFVTGLVSEDHLRTARPEYLDRLEREGQLEQLRVVVPHRTKLRPLIMTGFAVVAICLILLLAILLAALGK